MSEWIKKGIDLGGGAVAGVVDQLTQNRDEQQALKERTAGTLAADKKLPVMKQFGTYLNYGVPIVAILASAMGWVRGDNETRLVTIGGQLAGRKATHQFTTGSKSSTPSAAYTAWQRAQAAANAARGATTGMRTSVLEI